MTDTVDTLLEPVDGRMAAWTFVVVTPIVGAFAVGAFVVPRGAFDVGAFAVPPRGVRRRGVRRRHPDRRGVRRRGVHRRHPDHRRRSPSGWRSSRTVSLAASVDVSRDTPDDRGDADRLRRGIHDPSQDHDDGHGERTQEPSSRTGHRASIRPWCGRRRNLHLARPRLVTGVAEPVESVPQVTERDSAARVIVTVSPGRQVALTLTVYPCSP